MHKGHEVRTCSSCRGVKGSTISAAGLATGEAAQDAFGARIDADSCSGVAGATGAETRDEAASGFGEFSGVAALCTGGLRFYTVIRI